MYLAAVLLGAGELADRTLSRLGKLCRDPQSLHCAAQSEDDKRSAELDFLSKIDYYTFIYRARVRNT